MIQTRIRETVSCSLRAIALIMSCATTVIAQAGSAPQSSADSVAGTWRGVIAANNSRMPVSLRVTTDTSGRLIGEITVRDMAFIRSPLLAPVRVTDSIVVFGVGLSEGALRFAGKIRGNVFSGGVSQTGIVRGQWAAVGDTVPFSLERKSAGDTEDPYSQRNVTFSSGPLVLSGTLSVPADRAVGARPAVVIVSGSGPAVRTDGNFLADHFVRRGFVALTYDKRGVGGSTGDWVTASVPDLASDALSAIEFLKTVPGVDAAAIGLAGISQGGWVVINAAARSSNVRFAVIQAGPVLRPRINSLWRFKLRLGKAGISGEDSVRALAFLERDANVSRTRSGFAELMAAADVVKDSAWFKALGWSPSELDNPYRTWSARIDAYDPAVDLPNLNIPIAWFYGLADRAVDGRTEANAACRSPVKLRSVFVFPEADHGMRIEQPDARVFPHVDRSFLTALDRWLDRNVPASRGVPASSGNCPATMR